LEGQDLTVSYGDTPVLDGVDVGVAEQEFLTVMGPSGCGKTTLLNVLTGLVPLDQGSVRYEGEPVDPGAFPYGYVFQDPRLLDWRTVRENLAFALRGKGVPETEHADRIDEWLGRVGLDGAGDKYPRELSGGMRQRVGVARAMAVDPEVLVMDEPFASLDEVTARELRRDLRDLWADTGKEVLFVTHDIREAVVLSDRVLFMREGGAIFDEATIPVERPRDFHDPAVQETEQRLSDRFFAELS
jgi:NitT/TauT family transport system ATP-binding protein